MARNTRRKSRAPSTQGEESTVCGGGNTSEPGLNKHELDVRAIKSARVTLKRRLYGGDVPSKFWLNFGLEKQKRQLLEVFEQCVKFGESNSALLMGPRGSGKTKLIQAALQDLEESSDNYFVIFLNGLLQTDDRTSLQEISRQLKLENAIGDQVFGSFADNLAFILDSFKSGSQETRSVIVVLDEFDLFAQHKNQSLIYNLLDVSRNKETPIAVIGVTSRLDVIELLEKRVKSRYSHRSILTFSQLDFEEYLQMLRSLLILPADFEWEEYKEEWDKIIEGITEEKATREVIRKHFSITKDIRSLAICLAQVVGKISKHCPFITAQSLRSVFKEQEVDGKNRLLNGLSVLELCLIVAMKHVRDKRNGEAFNFDMVFKEYQTFVTKRSTTTQRFDKLVAMKAFEHLLAVEIVKPLHSVSQASLPKEFQQMQLLVDDSQIADVFSTYQGCPTDLREWATTMFV